MGIKVSDMLKLPSLSDAVVVAGKSQLDEIVSSLTFLEISDMTFFSDFINITNEYYAGEIVISSFYAIREDIEKQKEAVRHLHQLGEIGLILYYVGIVLPEIPEEVIQLADSLDFLMIQMPSSDASLRYNEAIYDIMHAIITSESDEHLFSNVLEKITMMPSYMQTVETTLKMFSDLLRSHLVLTNRQFEIVNQVKWPRSSTLPLAEILMQYATSGQRKVSHQNVSDISQLKVFNKNNGYLNLFVIKENGILNQKELVKAQEVIQVALNLWGETYDDISEFALVQAIVNDESDKMYRLAKILSIDVKAIQMMWLVHFSREGPDENLRNELQDFLSSRYDTIVIQRLDDMYVVLLGNYIRKESELFLAQEFLEDTTCEKIQTIAVCPRMRHTTDVRESYQLMNDVKEVIHRAFPLKKYITLAELNYLKKALLVIEKGEQEVSTYLSVLEPILTDKEYLQTTTTFLLDASGDFQLSGEILFLHKNTIKYRINKISNLLGLNLVHFSEAFEVYFSCIVYRLLNNYP